MASEINQLQYENTKVTFTNSTNNTETSDELKADPLYYRKLGTAYSTGKMVKRSIIVIGIAVTASSGAILTGNLISNSFVRTPEISNILVEAGDLATEIKFSFTIGKNDNNYDVLFTLRDLLGEAVFTYRQKDVDTYDGVITGLEAHTTYNYKISFTNNMDLIREIKKGQVTTGDR